MFTHFGGSFAPKLSGEQLASYRTLAAKASRPVADAMLSLATMVEAYYQQARLHSATEKGVPHASGRGQIVALTKPVVDAIDKHVPWEHELKSTAELFETIPNDTQKPLRDAAHHLLWYATELSKDREPITTDKI